MNAWDRRQEESAQSFAAFQDYLAQGPTRTIAETTRTLYNGAKHARTSAWARTYQWEVRALAWEDELARRAREAEAAEREDMARRQASQGVLVQQIGMRKLTGYSRAIQAVARIADRLKENLIAAGSDPDQAEMEAVRLMDAALPMDARDALAYVREGMLMERAARGESTAGLEDGPVVNLEMHYQLIQAVMKSPELAREADRLGQKVRRELKAVEG